MIHSVLAALVIPLLPITSALFYRFDRQRYSEGKSRRIPIIPGYRIAYRWVQLTTLIVAAASVACEDCAYGWALLQLYKPGAFFYVGLSVCICSVALFVWAKVRLGTEYSPCCDSLVANRLVATGPYAYIRHPISAANMAWLVGAFVATGSVWIILNFGILALYFVTSARQEERALVSELPAYGAYMTRTGAFLPRLYRASSQDSRG